MSSINKLQKMHNISIDIFLKIATPIVDYLCPLKYSPNRKYDNKYYLICLIDFVSRCTCWSNYNGTKEYPINGKYLNQIHNKFIKKNVYNEINKALINKYLSTGREEKLKIQCIDASFIANKRGSIKNNNHLLNDRSKAKNKKIRKHNNKVSINKRKKEHTFIDTNRYNGRKNYFKVSTITDSNGVPLSTTIIASKEHESTGFEKTINKIPIDLKTLNNSKINRYKQNFLADSAYHSKKIINILKKKGYNPLICYNKRNTRDAKKIKKNKFNSKDKKIYKRRFIIESFFAWIKNCPVINQNYQKSIASYEGLFSLASSLIICKKI